MLAAMGGIGAGQGKHRRAKSCGRGKPSPQAISPSTGRMRALARVPYIRYQYMASLSNGPRHLGHAKAC